MHYDYLAHCPKFVDEVAKYWQIEWSKDKSNMGFVKQKASILKKFSTSHPPFILVAHQDGKFVGTAALFVNDLESRQDLTPWLGGVFVVPDFRGKGVATSLIEKVLTHAKNIGFKKVYLHTEHTAGLYKKLGWKKMCKCKNDSDEESIIYTIKI